MSLVFPQILSREGADALIFSMDSLEMAILQILRPALASRKSQTPLHPYTKQSAPTRSVRGRLEAITRDRNASQKHAWRAAIMLSSAVGTNEIMRRTGKSKTCVWRWQDAQHHGDRKRSMTALRTSFG
jgi:hypothetical protein